MRKGGRAYYIQASGQVAFIFTCSASRKRACQSEGGSERCGAAVSALAGRDGFTLT